MEVDHLKSQLLWKGGMANVDCLECHCPGEMVDETEMLSGEWWGAIVELHDSEEK